MKKIAVYLSALLAVSGGVLSEARAQMPPTTGGTTPAPTAQPARPRIALVNIAKVLKEFNKANQDGLAITKRRQTYVESVKPLRDRLAELSKQVQQATNETVRAKLREDALTVNRQIEDIDRRAQEELGALSDKVIVDVYKQIKAAIGDIAAANNMDLVLCYPDASDEKDDNKPAVAQLKLQTPALIPFYHRNMDITDYVIKTLNARHPAPPVQASEAPKAAPGTGVTPTGGTMPPMRP